MYTVYFARIGDRVEIGRTDDLDLIMRNLSYDKGNDVELLKTIECDTVKSLVLISDAFREYFKDYKVEGTTNLFAIDDNQLREVIRPSKTGKEVKVNKQLSTEKSFVKLLKSIDKRQVYTEGRFKDDHVALLRDGVLYVLVSHVKDVLSSYQMSNREAWFKEGYTLPIQGPKRNGTQANDGTVKVDGKSKRFVKLNSNHVESLGFANLLK